MEQIFTTEAGWQARLNQLLERMQTCAPEIETAVGAIIDAVRLNGDRALFEYTRRFDEYDPLADGLVFGAAEMSSACDALDSDLLKALAVAAERIRAFHERQKEKTWTITDDAGVVLGQKISPLNSVGIYIPGGRNAFPSTVLMNVIPAVIAGVKQIVVVTPTPHGRVSPALLAAGRLAGAERIWRIGGAQAVAALAFGTESVPKVDKVVGPGNIYVATAKRMLQGTIGIDAIAGPSEIMVLADKGADPKVVAMDLMSQAEHDGDASALLVTAEASLAVAVLAELERQVVDLPRRDVIEKSLKQHGAVIVTRDLDEAFEIVNMVAPEHLELMLADAQTQLEKVSNAGAIFMGYHSPEGLGDYVAGPNHTLPTASTARFYSPLGVYDFQKRSSIIGFSAAAAASLGPHAVMIARAEELEAHARSVEYRCK